MTGEEILRYLSAEDVRMLCDYFLHYKWEAIERLLKKRVPSQ